MKKEKHDGRPKARHIYQIGRRPQVYLPTARGRGGPNYSTRVHLQNAPGTNRCMLMQYVIGDWLAELRASAAIGPVNSLKKEVAGSHPPTATVTGSLLDISMPRGHRTAPLIPLEGGGSNDSATWCTTASSVHQSSLPRIEVWESVAIDAAMSSTRLVKVTYGVTGHAHLGTKPWLHGPTMSELAASVPRKTRAVALVCLHQGGTHTSMVRGGKSPPSLIVSVV